MWPGTTADRYASNKVRSTADRGARLDRSFPRRRAQPKGLRPRMLFDMEALPPQERYKLLVASVVPRPIAWITTKSRAGIVNAAPFSFFNAMGSDPPTLAIGVVPREGRLKDTATNIIETGEFVVNLVSEANVEAMNV